MPKLTNESYSPCWISKELFEQQYETIEDHNSEALKLKVIEIALRCLGVTSANLVKTAKEVMEFLKQE